jgi:uroporphyrinogen III methyltransferase / synthase
VAGESSRERAAFVLAGIRVANTRPATTAAALTQALAASGAVVVREPLIRVEPVLQPAALREALAAERWDWVVLTSASAVQVLAEALPADRRCRIAAVGPATAAAAEAAGLTVSVVPAVYRSEAVAAAMAAAAGGLDGARIAWPRSAGARPELRAALLEAGALLDEIEAYRTVEDAEAGQRLAARIRARGIDVVTFTAPSAVRAFLAGGGQQHDAVVAVIGPVTAAAARGAGLEVHVEPGEQSTAAMVQALGEFYERRRASGTDSQRG